LAAASQKERPVRLPAAQPSSGPLLLLAGLASWLAFAGAAGCARSRDAANSAPVRPVAARPARPDLDYAAIQPNELGFIPIVMYHEICGKPVRSDPSLVRSVEAFRKDLDLMYAAGFRPVNLSDVLNNTMDLPAGKSPIVLTFDDARKSQFHLMETEKALKIDPNCAMGILDAFHKKHPDWPMRATFFVLPKSRKTMEPFGQPGMGAQKLAYLVEQGMEIGNHTTLHRDMSRMSPAEIQTEIGNAHKAILEAVPTAKIQAVALPMGRYPRDKKNWKYLTEGAYQGVSYRYKGALLAAYRAVPSPNSKQFNPMRLERIGPADVRWGVRWWLGMLGKGTGEYPRYVSDGDPRFVSVPKGTETSVNVAAVRARGQTLNVYAPFGGPGGSKPIVGAAAADGEVSGGAAAGGGATATETTSRKPISAGG
jgi:peptidoglycan/xylan/chitin deacetylase (PgdA/CDA1 family)